ncbi:MAG: cation:proton antiporter, partial [Mangrovicoccus sp.]|nr:cation:proton antiporter [Mangrovicoccus sp.]
DGGESHGARFLGFEMHLSIPAVIGLTILKVVIFVALMLIVGRRLIPWILHQAAHSGSRELFRLAVLAIALVVAFGAAQLFDVSLALGAFFAGMVMSESPLSQRAAQETLPLRDAFAVLFFVSVGMLFNPATLWTAPLPLLGTLLIILVGKSVIAYMIVRAFGHSRSTALTISASLAQIGEFSFILAELGIQLNLLPSQGRDLILAGAILSILLNPLTFAAIDRIGRRSEAPAKPGATEPAPAAVPIAAAAMPEPAAPALRMTRQTGHTILVGHGRVGSLIAEGLAEQGLPYLVVELAEDRIRSLATAGVEVIGGNAAMPGILAAANPAGARCLVVAIPEAFEAGQVVQQVRAMNPGLHIVARAHSDAEVAHLASLGADTVIMGEREIARGVLADLATLGTIPAATTPDPGTAAAGPSAGAAT